MKIHEIDSNLQVFTDITVPDIIWFDVKNAPFLISGVCYDEVHGCYTRMPQDIAKEVSERVGYLNQHTSGGRVRFRTNSDFIGIHAVMDRSGQMSHITLIGQSGFDLYQKKEGEHVYRYNNSYIPPMDMRDGYSSSGYTDGTLAEYCINFPLYDGVKELYVALKKDAVLMEPLPYRHAVPVVFYGSSITQGGCASRPGNSYQNILSRRLDMEYINLGFAGSGKAEDTMVRYLAGLKMSVFVCDYDYNAPNVEHLKKSHLPLYRTIRGSQPSIPIIFLSAPDEMIDEREARREIIYQTYKTALEEGDKNVYFIDGEELFAGEDRDSCTVDGTHPNDLGFYRMARRIEKTLAPLLV